MAVLDTDSMNVIRDAVRHGTTVNTPKNRRSSVRLGKLKFNPLFVPVRNLLRANKDADGRRVEIFQVRHGG